MEKSILDNIIENCDFEQQLPPEWKDIDYNRFSKDKTLYSYQREALQRASIILYQYYQDPSLTTKKRKKAFLKLTQLSQQEQGKHFTAPTQNSSTYDTLTDYFEEEDNRFPAYHLINRMSFWMATGSGKSLVLIKLLELFHQMMTHRLVPHKDILILTHRPDLIEQIKRELAIFNRFIYQKKGIKFIPRDLREFPKIKAQRDVFQENQCNIYYYRSDLVSNIQKERIIDFKNYENNGNWFLMLDEAHKGGSEESKRKQYYNILSRNGFLFNFSATFTDPIDLLTTVYNLNLATYIQKGFGKHLYLSQAQFKSFKRLHEEKEYEKEEKQKIVLMSIILLAFIKKQAEKLQKKSSQQLIYHNPLLLTLVNSVSMENSDLGLFFEEIKKIAAARCSKKLFKEAKEELIKDLNSHVQFENNPVLNSRQLSDIQKVTLDDILQYVFNTPSKGELEVRENPRNKQELSFRVKSGAHSKPFALIKIGKIKEFKKNHLTSYNTEEEYENTSLFENLDHSSINILMGSRAFYEGWDSNRPNIINFVNIGKNRDAKKFILQSIGRGIRIEPVKNHRKRLKHLPNHLSEVSEDVESVKPLETLFVFGTKRQAISLALEALETKKVEQEYQLNLFEKTATTHPLLVPVYKEVNKKSQRKLKRLKLHENDLLLFEDLFTTIDPKVIALNYNLTIKDINLLGEQYEARQKRLTTATVGKIGNPALLLTHIRNYYNIIPEEIDTFKELEEPITHYNHIKVRVSKVGSETAIANSMIETLKKKIEKVKGASQLKKAEKALDEDFEKGNIDLATYKKKYKGLVENDSTGVETFEYRAQKIEIRKLLNHYYIPSIISENERIAWMKHIIDVPSEIKFIQALEKHLKQEKNTFSTCDWWMFSKIDHSLDTDMRIPYIDPQNGKRDFLPDFVFWVQKDSEYHIVYVDPKGIGRQGFQHKVDGYSQLFEQGNQPKSFTYDDKTLKVHLRLVTEDKSLLGIKDVYGKYWMEYNELDFKLI